MDAQQKAFFLLEKHGTYAVGRNDILRPGPGELLVEVHSTSLNPVDWKIKIHDIFVEGYPAILGTDSAGIVKEVGEGVKEFVVGDRVLHQGYFDNRHATFQQYTLVPADIVAKIPENMTFDQASTVPLVLATAACGLYNEKVSPNGGAALTAPWLEGGRGKYAGRPIVVVGGASSVGQMVIQVARLSGFSPIIATASARHEAYLKSLGATYVLPRETVPLSSLASELRKIVLEPIKLVYDSISEPETQNAAYDLLSPGGQLILVLPPIVDSAKLADDKEVIYVFGNVHHPAQRAVGVALYKNMTELLRTGRIKPNNVEIIPDGLNGIFSALEKLEAGVSALKLVAHPQETQ